MPSGENDVPGQVADRDLAGVGQRVGQVVDAQLVDAQLVDAQLVALFDAVVVCLVGELQWQDPEVGQVLPVDAGHMTGQ